jgi:hypothetical protein
MTCNGLKPDEDNCNILMFPSGAHRCRVECSPCSLDTVFFGTPHVQGEIPTNHWPSLNSFEHWISAALSASLLFDNPVQIYADEKVFKKSLQELCALANLLLILLEWTPVRGLMEVAYVFAEGERKYGKGNWNLGMPWIDTLEHAIVHAYHLLRIDKDDEPDKWNEEASHALTNLYMLYWFVTRRITENGPLEVTIGSPLTAELPVDSEEPEEKPIAKKPDIDSAAITRIESKTAPIKNKVYSDLEAKAISIPEPIMSDQPIYN